MESIEAYAVYPNSPNKRVAFYVPLNRILGATIYNDRRRTVCLAL